MDGVRSRGGGGGGEGGWAEHYINTESGPVALSNASLVLSTGNIYVTTGLLSPGIFNIE